MRRISFSALAIAAATSTSYAACQSKSCAAGKCPVNNPVTDFFDGITSEYAWTAAVGWQNVFSVADYTGADIVAQIAAASADALKCTGNTSAVVYIPPGNYSVSGGFNLTSNIMLRGAVATGAARGTGTAMGDLHLPTTLTFPFLTQYNTIGCTGCANVGVVNLDLYAAAVSIAGAVPASAWAVVFGNRVRCVNYQYPNGPGTTFWQQWPWRFATAISMAQSPNGLVGNNLLAPCDRVFNVTVSLINRQAKPPANFTGSVPFDVDDRYGIQMSTPASATGSMLSVNMSVDSNWVWQNGRVGVFMTSADDPTTTARGTGGRVQRNHVEVAANTTSYSIGGVYTTSGSDTNENRAIDCAGNGVYAVNNSGHVHRQQAFLTKYLTVDGEGILHQPQDGMNASRNLYIGNDLRNGSSGYIGFYGLAVITDNTLIDNAVNPDQVIGVNGPNRTVENHGNVCQGNSPPCTGMNP